jgi:16S rRNA (guanine527-N7)-methyltransferase
MFQSLIESVGLKLNRIQIQKLESLADIVLEKNRILNLTSIRDRSQFLVKQILNSLMVAKAVEFKPGWHVADLGTGGGFPGLPLAIAYPYCHFVLIDSVQKKVGAVREFADQLSLTNVDTVSERIELLGRDDEYREKFDLVTAQALAPLNVLLELAIPFVKVGGRFVAFKGPQFGEELSLTENAISQLRLVAPEIYSYPLPLEMGERFLLTFTKSKVTPAQFPRQVGVPNKKPL